jgi:CRP-like cAMP-binding protein
MGRILLLLQRKEAFFMELSELSLFRGASERECYQIMSCLGARIASYHGGDVILSLGDANGRVGVVREGCAQLIRTDRDGNKALLEVLPEDSIFGATLAFSGTSGENQYVVAQTSCVVIFIPYAQFAKRCKNACMHHAQMLENLLRLISTKSLSLSERIEVITNRGIRAKLLYFFEMTAAKKQSKTFPLPFGFSALAEFLCVDRSAMTRELSRMKREGLVEIYKKTVTLL